VALTARASLPGGKCRLVGDLAAYDAQRSREGDPVGVVVTFSGRAVHQCSDGVVDEQEAVELLLRAVGML
jgi:hypothetical protein